MLRSTPAAHRAYESSVREAKQCPSCGLPRHRFEPWCSTFSKLFEQGGNWVTVKYSCLSWWVDFIKSYLWMNIGFLPDTLIGFWIIKGIFFEDGLCEVLIRSRCITDSAWRLAHAPSSLRKQTGTAWIQQWNLDTVSEEEPSSFLFELLTGTWSKINLNIELHRWSVMIVRHISSAVWLTSSLSVSWCAFLGPSASQSLALQLGAGGPGVKDANQCTAAGRVGSRTYFNHNIQAWVSLRKVDNVFTTFPCQPLSYGAIFLSFRLTWLTSMVAFSAQL